MSGYAFKTYQAIARCGCGGEGVIWDRPCDWRGNVEGTIEVFCSKHCGLGIYPHGYTRETRQEIGEKVVMKWNRALGLKLSRPRLRPSRSRSFWTAHNG